MQTERDREKRKNRTLRKHQVYPLVNLGFHSNTFFTTNMLAKINLTTQTHVLQKHLMSK